MNRANKAGAAALDVLQAAIALHLEGSLGQAEARYREVLGMAPGQADASHNLGLLMQQMGRAGEALPYFQAALAAQPDNAQFLISYSGALLDHGAAGDAARILDAALAHGVENAAIRCNRGNAARALNLLDDAEHHFRAALARQPNDALAHYNLASLMQERGRLDAAAAGYRAALATAPQFAQAQHNLADVHNDLGSASMHAGRIDDAIAHFCAAIAARAAFAPALSNLAHAYFARGQFDDAEAACREALSIDASLFEAHLNLGNVLQAKHRHGDAETSYRHALQSRPDSAEAHYNLGNLLQTVERLEEAVAHYQAALALQGGLAEAHNSMGNALRKLGQAEAAITCYRRALELKPDYAGAYSNLALALQSLDALEAEACCRKALALEPDLPEPLVFLADLHANRGEFGEAEQLLRHAIAAAPGLPSAWAGLVNLRTMTPEDQDWLDQALTLTAEPIPARQETYLQFAIGKYLDDVGQYDAAFTHYRRANELAKHTTPRYDARQEEALTANLCRDISREFIAKQRGTASDKPVFIVGMPRSGTSLLEQILAAHPQVFGAGELPFWTRAAHEALSRFAGGDDPRLPEQARRHLDQLDAIGGDAARVVDKMPGNFRYLGLIHAALPDARFIHLRRNPVDTCLSIYFQYFNEAHAYASDLSDLAHYYTLYRRMMDHWRAIVPCDRLFELAYEDLVDEPEYWSRAIVEFLGLAWDARCLDYRQNARAIGTASNWQARQSIGRHSVERWRRYAAHVAPLLPLLDEAS